MEKIDEDKNELENSDLEDQKQNLRKSSNSSKKSEHRKSPDQNNAANANRISGQANNYGSIPQKEDDLKSVGEGEDQNVDPKKFRGPDQHQDFLFKVFTIMAVQIAITVILTSIICINEALKDYLKDNFWWFFVFLASTISILFLLALMQNIARNKICSYTFLVFFTSSYSLFLVTFSAFIEPSSCLICYIQALIMFTSLSIICLTTKRTLPIIFVILIVLTSLAIISCILWLLFTAKWVSIIVLGSSMFLASLYFI